MGCFVLYHLRRLETHWSSLRLASFWTLHVGLSSGLSLLSHLLLKAPWNNGPQSFVVALTIQYIRFIPPVYESETLGFPINDHAFFYFLLAQLFFLSKDKGPFCLGLVSGVMYSWNVGGMASWRLPKRIQDWIRPWLTASGKKTPSSRRTLGESIPSELQGEPLLDENAVQMLVSMGFTRDQAMEALRRFDTVEQAVAHLIEQSG